ncbi:MAG: hypothetical protein IKJ62_01270 [Alphaproteobacteria bacterium]|nr:hypothetical protein [Alphaproteobacteria bacterium]
MKKMIIIAIIATFTGISDADAGYYRTKNTFTGGYTSTGRTNNLGMRRAPAGYHTNSYGIVQKNNPF